MSMFQNEDIELMEPILQVSNISQFISIHVYVSMSAGRHAWMLAWMNGCMDACMAA